MSRTCEICKRGPRSSSNISHSHVHTKRKQYLNLQKKKIDGKVTKICTKCIKSLNNGKTN